MKKVLVILNELADEDVDWLTSVGCCEAIEPGSTLIHEGKPVDTLYILLEGTLVVSISAISGREIARLSGGDVVGEMSFIDARPPSATVQTLEKCLVLSIPRLALGEKLQHDVAFAARFYRALAILLSNRLRGTVRQLGEPPLSCPTGYPADDNGLHPMAIAEARFQRLFEQLGVEFETTKGKRVM